MPAISMIGLELADLAVRDYGFQENDDNAKFTAIFTLIVIILSSLIRFKFLKNSSVLVGIIAGCVLSSILSITNIDMFLKPISLLKVPEINLDFLVHRPQNLFTLFIAVIPATMVSFTENLGRIAVLEGMIKRDNVQKDFLGTKLTYNSLKGHALSDLVSVICGAVPNQIYAENLAIMNLNNSNKSNKNRIKSDDDLFVNECYSPYTVIPYAIGAILSIVVACFGGLQNLFIAIPKPVFGGMEFFIFGLITASWYSVIS